VAARQRAALPGPGRAVALGNITTVAIGLLFFLHGAKLSREAICRRR
jgi:sodium/bile acid cotransporter 7